MTHHRTTDKSRAPSTELFASPAFSRLVGHFALHPRADLHFQALKRATGLANRSLQLELARLQRLGLIVRIADGRLVRYLLRPDQPRWRALREMVRQFSEPAELLRIALAQVPDITAAFVYGSFARCSDVHAESDIDLFVVSGAADEHVNRLALAGEVLEVSGFLGREVNVSRYTPVQLARKVAEPSRFVTSVLDGAKDWLVGGEKDLSAAIYGRSGSPRKSAAK